MAYVVVILLIFIIDDKIKYYIDKNKMLNKKDEKFGGKVIIEKFYNRGAILNFMDNSPKVIKYISGILLLLISIFMLFLIPQKGKKLLKLGLSFIIGGASSNFLDRLNKGYVVDYIGFKWIKNVIFNLSDLFIFLGAIIMMIDSFISDDK